MWLREISSCLLNRICRRDAFTPGKSTDAASYVFPATPYVDLHAIGPLTKNLSNIGVDQRGFGNAYPSRCRSARFASTSPHGRPTTRYGSI